MTPHLVIHGALIVRWDGWGPIPHRRAVMRLEFADVGEFNVWLPRHRPDKLVASMSIEQLEFNLGHRQVTSGGGFVGGGIGITGAVKGIAMASALNAMTRRSDTFTILGATVTLPDGHRRHADFSIATITEYTLRERLLDVFRVWSDAFVQATLSAGVNGNHATHDLDQTHAKYDRMQERGMLDPARALALRADASRPFLAALTQNLNGADIARSDAERINSQIQDMLTRQRITGQQAQPIKHLLAPVLTSPPKPRRPSAQRIEQLQALAELRATGVLTETEFQAEKDRILRED